MNAPETRTGKSPRDLATSLRMLITDLFPLTQRDSGLVKRLQASRRYPHKQLFIIVDLRNKMVTLKGRQILIAVFVPMPTLAEAVVAARNFAKTYYNGIPVLEYVKNP